ncbi:MAG: hypothetical protein ACXVCY_11330 [Pseudobdellovibrionaceae bacterium]
MGRLKKSILSFPKRFFLGTILIIGISVSLAACYNGSTNYPAPLYGFGCQNCGAALASPIPLAVFQSAGTDGSVVLSNMQMYGQATAIRPNASGSNYKWYQGPIAVQGTLTVSKTQFDIFPDTGQRASSCVVPAGVYTLQTKMVGQMDLQGVNVMLPDLITTVGGIELKIEAASPMGFISNGTRLWADVYIIRVNGVPCSANFFGEFN